MAQERSSLSRLQVAIFLPIALFASSFAGGYAAGIVEPPQYDRRAFGKFEALEYSSVIGFYTGKSCSQIDFDHVVSLKDAWLSGAWQWSMERREAFANDPQNLVQACRSINRSKGASLPKDFIRKAEDGKGLDYEIKNKCAYFGKYLSVKSNFELSLEKNDMELLLSCVG